MALTITCPICGRRNAYEFRYGGEDKGPRPDASDLTPRAWCDWAHMNQCVWGVQREWWCHRSGCNRWFRIARDTAQNRQLVTDEADFNGDDR